MNTRSNAFHSHRNQFSFLRIARSLCFLFLLLVFGPGPVLAGELYRLDSEDRLAIRVVEWQTVEGRFRDWSTINGEYTVGSNGILFIPLVGELEASGKTVSDVAKAVSLRLQERLALSDLPETSVEVAEYRPIFVFGAVNAPGRYPYSPGLTVLKALSLAGGQGKTPTGSSSRASRDVISAQGNLGILEDQYTRLLIRRARLLAETTGKSTIALVEKLPDEPRTEQIRSDEAAIMLARQEQVSREMKALDELKDLLATEIQTLASKDKSLEKQIALAAKERAGVDKLAQKGLAVTSRLSSAERAYVELQSKQLDLSTARLRVRQEISKATRRQIELQSTYTSDLAVERQKVDAELNSVIRKLKKESGLMSEAILISPSSAAITDIPLMNFSLVRQSGNETVEIEATENTAVLPGDVLKVVLAEPVLQ